MCFYYIWNFGKLLHPVLDHCYGNVKFCYDFSCASGRIVMVIVIKLTLFKLFIKYGHFFWHKNMCFHLYECPEKQTFCSWQAFHFHGVKWVNLDSNFKIFKKCGGNFWNVKIIVRAKWPTFNSQANSMTAKLYLIDIFPFFISHLKLVTYNEMICHSKV